MRSSSYFILTLIVAVPFLIAMIILYIFLLRARARNAAKSQEFCYMTVTAGILRRMSDDKDDMDIKCTGIVLGENIVVTLGSCISEADKSNYFVTSGSMYWSMERNLHRVSNVTSITSVLYPNKHLMVLEIEPDIPACIRHKKFSIYRKAVLKEPYEIQGWHIGTHKRKEKFAVFITTPEKKGCDINTGSIFDHQLNFFGIMEKCTEKSHEVLFLINFVDILRSKYERLTKIVLFD